MKRAYYAETISNFLDHDDSLILGKLTENHSFRLELAQTEAWRVEIQILKSILSAYHDRGKIYLEYSIPRLGKRIDAVVLIGAVIFTLEFKVGEKDFAARAIDQVCDYALDLKNFHESSHSLAIAPILVATEASAPHHHIAYTARDDKLLIPIESNTATLGPVIRSVLDFVSGSEIDLTTWEAGRYHPTPTIIEAATALYNGHSVTEISRSDAGAINLSQTSQAISDIISESKTLHRKSICFVTGVPGAGKTLVGLNVATTHIDAKSELHSVFLSGNGPLVAILREALARDKVRHEAQRGTKVKKGVAMSEVKMFIQNVHHFRDESLVDSKPPIEHVAIFDEAQRAWNQTQTANFMLRKKKVPNFTQSEPEFLISCLNRHQDWAVVVCLVGGGQEINTGEAGISEWIDSIIRGFPDWHIYISPQLTDSEYAAGHALEKIASRPHVTKNENLHLSVSLRSFRAERLSLLIKQILDLEEGHARRTLTEMADRYPLVITRNLTTAKSWLKSQARGSERYGIVVSSQAQRLKPHAIDVKSPMDPVHWFLKGKEDVRSSYYLEDVATEFHVQGLELDWACVTWDADFRYRPSGWEHWSFCGHSWNHVKKAERKMYLKNAYRVLLTRARQGMVIVVPEGDASDPTRKSQYYDPTYNYLREIGFPSI